MARSRRRSRRRGFGLPPVAFKRVRKGLGLSTEEHITQAREFYRRATFKADQAHAFAVKGDCKNAMRYLLWSTELHAMASTHHPTDARIENTAGSKLMETEPFVLTTCTRTKPRRR